MMLQVHKEVGLEWYESPLIKKILEYLLCFAFLISNNIMEYEALIIGVNLARKLEIEKLIAHSNS